MGVVGDTALIALEVAVVDGVKAHKGHEDTPVGLGDAPASSVALMRQARVQPVQGFGEMLVLRKPQPPDGFGEILVLRNPRPLGGFGEILVLLSPSESLSSLASAEPGLN